MHILRQAVLLYGVTLEVIEATSRMLNCSEGKAACEPKLEPDRISVFLQPVQLHSYGQLLLALSRDVWNRP